jgi:hypothetical protein
MGTVSCHNKLSKNGSRVSGMVAQALSMRKEPDASGSFLMLNEKRTIQVYDTKLMTGMEFQGHICTTALGDK